MKNALILHGTDGSSKENWFAWLKTELEERDWTVWVPDLPGANKPNIKTYSNYIFSNETWKFNEDTILVGHSSGAVAILGILENLPENTKVGTCYLVGAFDNDLGWESLRSLFEKPLNLEKIRTKANHFVFIHSDNDPYCPLEGAKKLANDLDGELIVKKSQRHFSVGTMGKIYSKFPLLLKRILSDQRQKEARERFQTRVNNLISGKAHRAYLKDPEIAQREMQEDKISIYSKVAKTELVSNEVLKLIKELKNRFENIYDQTILVASYLLLGKAFSSFNSAISLAKKGKSIEMVEITRSAHEALDLVFLFNENTKPDLLSRWFEGETIDNSLARRAFDHFINQNSKNDLVPAYDMKNLIYGVYSQYTHSSYTAIFDYINVYTQDFDFDGEAGFHYSNDYFDMILNNLLINIILALKNVYGLLEDKERFLKTSLLLRLAGQEHLSADQIKALLKKSGV